MKKILPLIAICCTTVVLSACSKKIEPNNYYCLQNAVTLKKDYGVKEPSDFLSKCKTQKLGRYNTEYTEAMDKNLQCAFENDTAQCSKPFQEKLKQLEEQWRKEAGE